MSGWILSWNPTMFDLDQLRREGEELDSWSISRYRNDVREGDPFVLWRTGRDAGVIALGIVAGAAFKPDKPPHQYWNTEPGDRWYLPIMVDRWLPTPISRNEFAQVPDLANSSIIRQAFAGNPHRLSDDQWTALLRLINRDVDVPPLAGIDNPLFVPRIAGEDVEGPDLLGITPDATALASVITWKHLQPPLAVGLYGEWGSGKTFFMHAVQKASRELSTSKDPNFCRRVEHVTFSAWHYSEGNLWASLLHRIFFALQGDDDTDPAVERALAQTESAKRASELAEARAGAAEAELADAEEHSEKVQTEYQEALAEAQNIRARDVWTQVTADEQLKGDLDDAARRLHLEPVGSSAHEVLAAAQEIRQLASRVSQLATVRRGRRWWSTPLAAGVLAVVVVSLVCLGLGVLLDAWGKGLLNSLIANIGQIAALASGAAAWLSQQAGVARGLLRPAENIEKQITERVDQVRAEHERELAAADERQRIAERKLLGAQRELADAKERVRTAQAELDALRGPQRLARYIAERAASNDYSQHLGIIAMAHRDLRVLSTELLGKHESPTIERIVLYIDDLDRCPPHKVTQVLEAVHLLLALPLFAVIVGVDPRWLSASLRRQHPDLIVDPHDYLDKIFQFTFTMPTLSNELCGDYLVANASQELGETSPTNGQTSRTASQGADREAPDNLAGAQQLAEALQLGEDELDSFRLVAPLVRYSPRRAKRFGNVYRLVKARAFADDDLRDQLTSTRSLRCLMVTLAVASYLPEFTGQSDQSLQDWLGTQSDSRLLEFAAATAPLDEIKLSELLPWLRIVRPFT